jgi:hypothetical protein
MDRIHSYSFPGLVFLLAQLTYRFVPYGFYILLFVLTVLLFSGTVRMIYQVFQRLHCARAL